MVAVPAVERMSAAGRGLRPAPLVRYVYLISEVGEAKQQRGELTGYPLLYWERLDGKRLLYASFRYESGNLGACCRD